MGELVLWVIYRIYERGKMKKIVLLVSSLFLISSLAMAADPDNSGNAGGNNAGGGNAGGNAGGAGGNAGGGGAGGGVAGLSTGGAIAGGGAALAAGASLFSST